MNMRWPQEGTIAAVITNNASSGSAEAIRAPSKTIALIYIREKKVEAWSSEREKAELITRRFAVP